MREDPPHSEQAVEVMLAEFNALRAEILGHATAQAAVVGIGLTALGIIIGFVAKEGGSDRLLLAIPPLALGVILLHTSERYRINMIGRYIRQKLWPSLQQEVGTVPSWQIEDNARRLSGKLNALAVLLNFAGIGIFLVASIATLVQVGPGEALWWVDLGLTAVALAVPIGIGLMISAAAQA